MAIQESEDVIELVCSREEGSGKADCIDSLNEAPSKHTFDFNLLDPKTAVFDLREKKACLT